MGTIFRVPVVVELKIAKIWTLQLDGGVEYLVQSGCRSDVAVSRVLRLIQAWSWTQARRTCAHPSWRLRRAKPDFVDRRPSWPKEWQPHPEAKGVRFGFNRVDSKMSEMSPLMPQ
jgi:hypothetical protein